MRVICKAMLSTLKKIAILSSTPNALIPKSFHGERSDVVANIDAPNQHLGESKWLVAIPPSHADPSFERASLDLGLETEQMPEESKADEKGPESDAQIADDLKGRVCSWISDSVKQSSNAYSSIPDLFILKLDEDPTAEKSPHEPVENHKIVEKQAPDMEAIEMDLLTRVSTPPPHADKIPVILTRYLDYFINLASYEIYTGISKTQDLFKNGQVRLIPKQDSFEKEGPDDDSTKMTDMSWETLVGTAEKSIASVFGDHLCNARKIIECFSKEIQENIEKDLQENKEKDYGMVQLSLNLSELCVFLDLDQKIQTFRKLKAAIDFKALEKAEDKSLFIQEALFGLLSSIDNVWDFFEPGGILGKGYFGSVQLVTLKEYIRRMLEPEINMRPHYALKVCKVKKSTDEKLFISLKNEETVMRFLSGHPQTVKLYASGLDPKANMYFFLMEYIHGSNLWSECVGRIKRNNLYSMDELRELTQVYVSMVKGLIQKGVVHRDIKPNNLIRDENGRIVVIDFGFASLNVLSKGHVGCQYFISPELAKQGLYSHGPDIWNIGVSLYAMATGGTIMPFSADDVHQKTIKLLQAIDQATIDKRCDELHAELLQMYAKSDSPESAEDQKLMTFTCEESLMQFMSIIRKLFTLDHDARCDYFYNRIDEEPFLKEHPVEKTMPKLQAYVHADDK